MNCYRTAILTGVLVFAGFGLSGCQWGHGERGSRLAASAPAATAPVAKICLSCGEFKGTEKCCKTEGRVKCAKCGLLKGSAACCKVPKDYSGTGVVCVSCGELKGTKMCCKTDGRVKCSKCGLLKGSIGCCKLPRR